MENLISSRIYNCGASYGDRRSNGGLRFYDRESLASSARFGIVFETNKSPSADKQEIGLTLSLSRIFWAIPEGI